MQCIYSLLSRIEKLQELSRSQIKSLVYLKILADLDKKTTSVFQELDSDYHFL